MCAHSYDVSNMFDRETTKIPSMQMGFIDFVVFPMFCSLIAIFPAVEPAGRNLVENARSWAKLHIEEIEAGDLKGGSAAGEDNGALEQEIQKTKARGNALEKKLLQVLGE